jgi:predicted RNase H-like nuclease
MNLIGIDLAWQSEKNTSAAAVGQLDGNVLSIHDLREDLDSVESIVEFVAGYPDVEGIAIDAPLIINNITGQRSCEKDFSRVYGARKASCHTSNLGLYPDAPSVDLGSRLVRQGYAHLGASDDLRWQVECYPHPAIIEIFGLKERLLLHGHRPFAK